MKFRLLITGQTTLCAYFLYQAFNCKSLEYSHVLAVYDVCSCGCGMIINQTQTLTHGSYNELTSIIQEIESEK
jgi:hypothetical protein